MITDSYTQVSQMAMNSLQQQQQQQQAQAQHSSTSINSNHHHSSNVVTNQSRPRTLTSPQPISNGSHRSSKSNHHGRHQSTTKSGSPPMREISFVPDNLAGQCYACQSPFTFTRRKHHCRHCGNVLCASCSSKKIILRAHSLTQPVRVCDACYNIHFQREHLRSMRRPSLLHQQHIYQQQHQHQQAGFNVGTPGSAMTPVNEQQPNEWNEEFTYGAGSNQGWGASIDVGGRWFSSFFFADPAATAAAAANSAANPPLSITETTQSSDPHTPNLTVHINPNHIEPVARPNPNGASRLSLSGLKNGLLQTVNELPAQLLTPDQFRSFTLLLFKSYVCVNLLEEKIKLELNDVIYHTLPRKHVDSIANESEVDEQITKRCQRYLATVQAQVRKNREAWKSFMESYDYEADNPSPAQPPPFLSYPTNPPPLSSGTVLVTNFQLVFIPDFTIYYYWNHVLCLEERRLWKMKKDGSKKAGSIDVKRVGRRSLINRSPTSCQSNSPSPSHSTSPSLSPSPDEQQDTSPIESDQNHESPNISEPPNPLPISPRASVDDSPQIGAPLADSILIPATPHGNDDVLNAFFVKEGLLPSPRAKSNSLPAPPSQSQSRSQSMVQRPVEPPTPLAHTTIPHAASQPAISSASPPPIVPPIAVTNALTANSTDLSASQQLSNSSSIFHTYKNVSHFHLPHYRLYQVYIQGSSASPPEPDFDPLLFSPPFLAIPLLALRKLKTFSDERKDMGTIELKTKLHHGITRFILVQLIKKQKFSVFKNLSKCIEFYFNYTPTTDVITQQPSINQKRTELSNGALSNLRSPPSGGGANHAPQSEIQQKVFAFRHTWLSTQPTAKSASGSGILSRSDVMIDPGWSIYDPLKEYRRMNLVPPLKPTTPLSCYPFRVTDVNRNYTFCPSYPRVLIVPTSINDGDLTSVGSFRSKKRIPTVVWSGRLPAPPTTSMRLDDGECTTNIKTRHGILLRSAQPLTGLTGQRCPEDEQLLHHTCAAIDADRLLIVDCRPMANAIGQAALGCGYENVLWYQSTPPTKVNTLSSPMNVIKEAQIQFLNIENIHVARKTHGAVEKMIIKLIEEENEMSLNCLRYDMGVRISNESSASTARTLTQTRNQTNGQTNVTTEQRSTAPPTTSTNNSSPPIAFPGPHPSSASWLSNLHSSGHFLHLSNILTGVNQVLSCMSQGICILVHCSDGWDRTSLLTSLSQLALDSYYRTLEGFIVLIEKEWLSFGHRFADRLGHGHFSQECSPIMLQFLDCVYQYLEQFQTQFQFDQRLLVFIYHHLYSGLFGTFMFNSEEERHRNRAQEKTRSIWSYVLEHAEEFVSPIYGLGWADLEHPLPSSHAGFESMPVYHDSTTLYIDTKSLQFWSDLYFGSRTPLVWNWNLIPKTSPTAASQSIVPAAFVNPRMDVQPVQLFLDMVQTHDQLESTQIRLNQIEVESCLESICNQIEVDDLQAKVIEFPTLKSELHDTKAQLERSEEEAALLRAQLRDVKNLEEQISRLEAQMSWNEVSAALASVIDRIEARQQYVLTVPEPDDDQLHDLPLNSPPTLANASGVKQAFAIGTSATPSTTTDNTTTSIEISASPSASPPIRPSGRRDLSTIPLTILKESEFKNADHCKGCHVAFGWLRGRHHCRRCGSSYCDTCAPKKKVLVEIIPEYRTGRVNDKQTKIDDQRICHSCEETICKGSNTTDHKLATSSARALQSTPPTTRTVRSQSMIHTAGKTLKDTFAHLIQTPQTYMPKSSSALNTTPGVFYPFTTNNTNHHEGGS